MFGALLTDLSKAFDCLLRDVTIAKLNTCWFDMKALNFIYDCLRNRKQRTKQIIHIAPGKTYYMVFLKNQFWGQFYSISEANLGLLQHPRWSAL